MGLNRGITRHHSLGSVPRVLEKSCNDDNIMMLTVLSIIYLGDDKKDGKVQVYYIKGRT